MVAGDALYVNNYISAAKQKNILREEYALLITGWLPKALNRSNPDTGILALVEKGTEIAANLLEYDVGIIEVIV